LCEGSIDQVVGLVNFKDVLWQSQESRDNLDFKKIRREILFVPENKPLTKLLKDFQRNKIHMAIVIDEFGITSGLATLEDVLEELVGEIQDEYDQEKSNIQLLRDGSYLINGSTLIEEVEEKLGLKIDKEENTTIAGAVLSKLGELPKVGDRVEFGAFEFVVQSLKGRRIYLLKVVKKAIKA
jgi:CBS domain containing-hemolysin-like protein